MFSSLLDRRPASPRLLVWAAHPLGRLCWCCFARHKGSVNLGFPSELPSHTCSLEMKRQQHYERESDRQRPDYVNKGTDRSHALLWSSSEGTEQDPPGVPAPTTNRKRILRLIGPVCREGHPTDLSVASQTRLRNYRIKGDQRKIVRGSGNSRMESRSEYFSSAISDVSWTLGEIRIKSFC